MADQYSGKQRIGLIQQSKASNHWGTLTNVVYGVAASDYKLLNYDKGVSIFDPDVQIDQQNFINQRGLVNEVERVFIDNASGLPSLPFSGVATLSLVAPHFVAALQAVSEGATTPFTKTITSAFKSGAVDFAANEGFLFSLASENVSHDTDVTDIGILRNALLNTFEFSIEPNNRGVARLAKISGLWVGGTNTILTDSQLSGSLTAMPTTGFFNNTAKFTLTLVIGSTTFTDICFKRFSLRIENNISSDCRGSGGVPLNFKVSPRYYIDIDLPYIEDQYHTIQSLYKTSGQEVQVLLATGTPGASGHLQIDCDSGVLVENPLGFDGDYFSRPIRIELLSKASDDQTPIEVTLSDAVDWGF